MFDEDTSDAGDGDGSTATVETDTDSDKDATLGDVEGDDESGDNDSGSKKDRKMDRIKKLAASKRKAEERTADLEEQVKTLTKLAADKVESKDEDEVSDEDLEDMGFSDKQVAQLKKVVNKAGGIPALQNEITGLKQELKKDRENKALSEDNKEKKSVLKKYEGVVADEEELDEMIETLSNDPNPRVRAIASTPWENIVNHFKREEIAEQAADETIKSKKKGGPSIKGGGADRVPTKKSTPLPTANLSQAGDVLLNRVLEQMADED